MHLDDDLKGLFIPRKDNNYRAGILDLPFLAFLVVLFLSSQASLRIIALVQPGVLGYASDITPGKIVELTNQERAAAGLPALTLNNSLSQGAGLKANDMFAFDYWAHESPTGRQPWEFFREAGYDYRVAGENLARDFMNAEEVVSAWMKSPSHKDNILNPKYQEIGVAAVNGTLGGIKTTLVVQFFGTPSQAVAAKLPEPETLNPVVVDNSEIAGEVPETSPLIPVQAAEGAVVREPEPSSQKLINPVGVTQKMSTFVVGIVTGALLLDGYLYLRKKVYRSTGRTTAHVGFMVLVIVLVLLGGRAGVIF